MFNIQPLNTKIFFEVLMIDDIIDLQMFISFYFLPQVIWYIWPYCAKRKSQTLVDVKAVMGNRCLCRWHTNSALRRLHSQLLPAEPPHHLSVTLWHLFALSNVPWISEIKFYLNSFLHLPWGFSSLSICLSGRSYSLFISYLLHFFFCHTVKCRGSPSF